MVSYIADRGIGKELPEPTVLALLDLAPEDRAAVPIADVMALHQGLARAVAPAFPETIEKLHEYRMMPGWFRRLAPLNSILWLIVVSAVLVLLFGFGLSGWSDFSPADRAGGTPPAVSAVPEAGSVGLPPVEVDLATEPERTPYFFPVIEYLHGQCRFSEEELIASAAGQNQDLLQSQRDALIKQHYEDCQAERRPILLRIFLFFGALGMLGAAYSSIYDSFSYIREGRYDMRLASTYYVRIFLGGFSGILLAEPLSDYLDQGVLSSALLAFIGGFSAQLVYDLLTKLVDSVANMFREDRRKERQSILAQAEYGTLGVIQQHDAAQREELARILADAQQEQDANRRATVMQEKILGIMSGETPNPVAVGPQFTVIERLQRALGLAEISVHAAPLWPDAAPGAVAAATAAQTALRDALEKLQASAGAPQDLATARAALERVGGGDLATAALTAAMDALRGALSGPTLRATAKGALAACIHVDEPSLRRWRHVAYQAASPTIALLCDVAPGDLGGGLALPGGGEITAQEMLTQDAEALFARPGGFGDRAGFDAAYEAWIDAAVRRLLAAEWNATLAPVTGSAMDGAASVSALSQVSSDVAARGGLQRLELLSGAVPKTTDPEATLARLMALVDTQLAGEAS